MYQHLLDTVVSGVELESEHQPSVNQDSDNVSVWGVTEGNSHLWERLDQGNYLLFYVGDYKYEYVAKVTGTVEDPKLAEKLWPNYDPGESGGNDPGDPWNYIIFLDSPIRVDIDSDEIHDFAGHSVNYPQRFMPLNDQAHAAIKSQFSGLENYFNSRIPSHVDENLPSNETYAPPADTEEMRDRTEHTLWLFNIRPVNWKQCVGGPPDNKAHSGHHSSPWHGLSENVAWLADEMQSGDTAIVRQSKHGIMGIWEIAETVPVRSQSHHQWNEDYSQFIYCRALHRELENPVDDTEFFDGQDFVRFNLGANKLNETDSKRFLEEIRQRAALEPEARRQIDAELEALGIDDTRSESSSESEPSIESKSETSDKASTKIDRSERASDLRPPDRTETTVSRIIRNTALAKDLKERYDHECQVCSEYRKRTATDRYAEAHHIQPLGGNPPGPDVAANILVLCPNHHTDFDYGLIEVDPDTLTIHHAYNDSVDGTTLLIRSDHSLDREYLEYHNKELSNL